MSNIITFTPAQKNLNRLVNAILAAVDRKIAKAVDVAVEDALFAIAMEVRLNGTIDHKTAEALGKVIRQFFACRKLANAKAVEIQSWDIRRLILCGQRLSK